MTMEGMAKSDSVARELGRIHRGLMRTLGNLDRWNTTQHGDSRPCLDLLPEQIIRD